VKRRGGIVASYGVLVIAVVVALFPVFWTVSTSIKTRVDSFANPPRFFRFEPTGKNYRILFGKEQFWQIARNTVVITVTSTILAVAIGSLTAYALARHPRFGGRRPLEAAMVLVRTLPGIVVMVPLFQVVTRLGLYDSRFIIILVYAAANLPFAIWLMTGFIGQIPIEVEECARTDGANRVRTFLHVVLPLALPGVAATMIFVALLSWNEFLIPVLLAGEGSKTLPVYIAGFISARTLDWGPMAAASALAIVPIAVFTALIQRRLVAGLSSGAVKG
jgi:ABC-type glycerol-3-phosphate transport system permease component